MSKPKTSKEEPTPRLPGMPGPGAEILRRREAVQNAIRDLHSALLPILDNMRSQEAARFSFNESIAGDRIQITITPKEETNQ